MLLRVITGRVIEGREADFVGVCRAQVAANARTDGLVAFMAGYRRAGRSDEFLLAATWSSEEDAVRGAGHASDPDVTKNLAGVATINAFDVYTVIEPAFRGIIDAPGGVIRLTTGRVPLNMRDRMLEWLKNPTRERSTNIQRLMLGWAVGERRTPDGDAIEVVAASAWPSPLVIEAVAERAAADAPIYADVDSFATDFHVEQYRAIPLDLPDAMADIGSRRLIAARFAARAEADAAAASLAAVFASPSDAQVSVAPLGAPGKASDSKTYILVTRVAINEYARAERLIVDQSGEVILSQPEPAPESTAGDAAVEPLSAGDQVRTKASPELSTAH